MPEPADANQIDAKRRFYCPSRVQAFCSASNIRSGCTANGEFRSNAMDTCRECKSKDSNRLEYGNRDTVLRRRDLLMFCVVETTLGISPTLSCTIILETDPPPNPVTGYVARRENKCPTSHVSSVGADCTRRAS
ncbi:hypothetical protein DCS_02524 [Drechmeria coniospora]|uniref:Uncharacterized protein n=1 Tax=Drechmeria coniospora TaxID=98403 RepID=A0A151GWH4_DRECN|nr:hypothetical protein DCS_02524 [Drechmeria coniospora]KYK61382.1 hypothetical protein DCS_02524 [Drechmeria coniospora]